MRMDDNAPQARGGGGPAPGIPYPEVTQCGLFPVAYSVGTDFKKASRIPASQVTHWDRW